MSMKVCVIGLGRFGYNVATTLAQKGIDVLAVDKDEFIIASIRDSVTQAICMHIHNQNDLLSLGVEEMDLVIVGMGENFDQTILMTALLKKRLHTNKVISRAINSIHQEILTLIGADETVIPEKNIGVALAERLSSPFQQFNRISKDFFLVECIAPDNFVNSTLTELDLYNNYSISCVGIKKDTNFEPVDPHYVIRNNDILLFAGDEKDLKKIT